MVDSAWKIDNNAWIMGLLLLRFPGFIGGPLGYYFTCLYIYIYIFNKVLLFYLENMYWKIFCKPPRFEGCSYNWQLGIGIFIQAEKRWKCWSIVRCVAWLGISFHMDRNSMRDNSAYFCISLHYISLLLGTLDKCNKFIPMC